MIKFINQIFVLVGTISLFTCMVAMKVVGLNTDFFFLSNPALNIY